MAQINPTVGDLRNARRYRRCRKAASSGCDLVLFPELALTGYPPEDLLLKPRFIEDNLSALSALAASIKGITAVIGFIDSTDDIYNAAAICHGGKIIDVYHKMYLPNYGVFDERRYFKAGTAALNFTRKGIKIGVGICEDIWYPEGPARVQALSGARLIVNINASPYHMGKALIREEMLVTRALDNGVVIAYNNTVRTSSSSTAGADNKRRGLIIARAKPSKKTSYVILSSPHNFRLHRPEVRDSTIRQPP